ncbi:hypothetical protein [Clostridium sp.]|uniref:hypothetical protein n=1 Tax=Clostridium sp. TaxID=1506 RepID=UPI0039963789
MKKIKKKVFMVAFVGIGIIFLTIDWNRLIIGKFNSHIKNQLRIAEMESNSNSQYMSFGENMVVNYSGQIENKGQIYNELVTSTNNILAKNGIYLTNTIVKVDFNEIKVMSGIKYYPVEVYTIDKGTNRELKYSFYISLDSTIMPNENANEKIGVNSSISMVNDFGNNNQVNATYDLNSSEINNYNNNELFTESQKKLYYRLCEMAELNIFGTTYVNGYNFVTNMSAPINYNGSNYYEILMYNNNLRNSENGGLLYKFFMTASGNIVPYTDVKVPSNNNVNNNNTTANNNDNNSDINNNSKANTKVDEENNKSINTKEDITSNSKKISENNENQGKIEENKFSKSLSNNLYKLVIEYENLILSNKTYKFNINSQEEIKGIKYYNIKITGDNNFVDSFYITDNGEIYKDLNKS